MTQSVYLTPTGWASRVLPLLLLGLLLGHATDRERRAQEGHRKLEAAALLHREAIEINDSLIQGMAAAKWSFESGQVETGTRILDSTIADAHDLVFGADPARRHGRAHGAAARPLDVVPRPASQTRQARRSSQTNVGRDRHPPAKDRCCALVEMAKLTYATACVRLDGCPETRSARLIQTSPHSMLASRLRAAPASFQLDEFDEYTQTGWSVLVRGSAGYVDPTDLPAYEDRPHTWAEGQRTLHIRITPHEISGRRLLPA